MASIRTSDVSVDDIDLGWDDDIDHGWDDESSSAPAVRASSTSPPALRTPSTTRPAVRASPTFPPAGRAPSIQPAMNPTPASRGAAIPQRSSSPRARAAMPAVPITPLQAQRSMPPPATPSLKPTGKQAASPITPRAMLAVEPAERPRPSVAKQPSTPPSSVRPVSMPPRPGSSSRSPETPSVVAAQAEVVAPRSPVLPQVSEKPAPPLPVAAASAIDLAPAVDTPATPAPVAGTGKKPLEPLPCAPSISAEWHEAGQDTLRPSQVELPPPLSNRAPRLPPRSTLLAAAIVALAGVIWLVLSSTSSKPDAIAAVPTAVQIVRPTRAAAARLPSTAKAAATPATSAHAPGLVESAQSALVGTEDTVLVAVHVSPPNAVIFKGGQRFGTGEVTVKVVRGTRTTLFARLHGYLPRTIVVDGTKSSVNIALTRPQSARATVARKQPAQEAVTSSPKSDEEVPARAGEPSEGASKSADTAAADTPDPEPSKRSDPMSDGDPL
jgi:hypothetical protein